MGKLLFVIGGVVLVLLFLGMYEAFFLLYYEESKSDAYVNYIAFPVYIVCLLFLIISGGYLSYRKRNIGIFGFMKEVVATLVMVAVFHYGIFQPSMSGLIQLINSADYFSKEYMLEGKVDWIYSSVTKKSAVFELTIIDKNGETYILETRGLELKKYKVGQKFKRNFKLGCLGLLYEHG